MSGFAQFPTRFLEMLQGANADPTNPINAAIIAAIQAMASGGPGSGSWIELGLQQNSTSDLELFNTTTITGIPNLGATYVMPSGWNSAYILCVGVLMMNGGYASGSNLTQGQFELYVNEDAAGFAALSFTNTGGSGGQKAIVTLTNVSYAAPTVPYPLVFKSQLFTTGHTKQLQFGMAPFTSVGQPIFVAQNSYYVPIFIRVS